MSSSSIIAPDLAALLLMNAQSVMEVLPQVPLPPDEIKGVTAALGQLPDDRVPDFLQQAASLLLEIAPEVNVLLTEIEDRRDVRGPDASTLAAALDVWNAVKGDLGGIATLIVMIRLLASNKVKTKGFEYQGGSVFTELAKLIEALKWTRGDG